MNRVFLSFSNHRNCSASDSDDGINNREDIGLRENVAQYAQDGFKTVKNEAYEVVPNPQEHTYTTITSD